MTGKHEGGSHRRHETNQGVSLRDPERQTGPWVHRTMDFEAIPPVGGFWKISNVWNFPKWKIPKNQVILKFWSIILVRVLKECRKMWATFRAPPIIHMHCFLGQVVWNFPFGNFQTLAAMGTRRNLDFGIWCFTPSKNQYPSASSAILVAWR